LAAVGHFFLSYDVLERLVKPYQRPGMPRQNRL